METRSVRKQQLMTTATELLREESCEGLESVVRVLQTLNQTHGSLGKGVSAMDLVSDKNEDGGGKQPKIKSSVLGIPKEKLSSRTKMFNVNRMDHPFRNSVILKNLFQFCCIETLKTCRLVAKEWYHLSLDAFRRSAVVRLSQQEHEHRLMELRGTFGKSVENVRMITLHWARQSRMHELVPNLSYLDINTSVNTATLEYICSNFRHLRYLNLGICWVPAPAPQMHVFQLQHNLPKMKTLKLTFSGSDMERFQGMVQQLSYAVFERLPNLDALHVKFKSYDKVNTAERIASLASALRNFLTAAMNLRSNRNFSEFHLTELNISQPENANVSAMSIDLVQTINACQFPLKRLTVDIGKGTTPLALKSLLEPHANNLEFFRTIIMLDESLHGSESEQSLFPDGKLNFPKLERMEVVAEASTAFLFLGSFGAMKLETLIISQEKAEELRTYHVGQAFWMKMKNTDVCSQDFPLLFDNMHLPSLKEFRYDGRVYFNETELEALAKAMPNLKHLEMNSCRDSFTAVCKLWPGLRKLLLTSSNDEYPALDDFTVTGLEWDHFKSTVADAHHARKPNVTDLKDLTDFTYIHSFGEFSPCPWQLTCNSVYHGFLQLPRLHFLDVGFRKLSFHAMLALENRVPNHHVFCEEYFNGDWRVKTAGHVLDWSVIINKAQSTREDEGDQCDH